MTQTCPVCGCEGCERPVIARGLCSTHYARARRANAFELQKHPRKPTLERLLALVDRSGGPDACWPWTGARRKTGHGFTYIFEGDRRREIGAHKAVYMEMTGNQVPDGMQVLHSCQNPPCCNPKHLRVGTHRENMVDRQADGERHPRGNWSPRFVQVADETVAAIRADYRSWVRGHTIRDVARRHGLDQAMVWQIVNHVGRWAESA